MKVLRGSWNEDLFRVLEGFPELAHDDEVDACSGALEMLNPAMKGWGVFEYTVGRPRSSSSGVRLSAPHGIGSVQTYSGRHLNPLFKENLAAVDFNQIPVNTVSSQLKEAVME